MHGTHKSITSSGHTTAFKSGSEGLHTVFHSPDKGFRGIAENVTGLGGGDAAAAIEEAAQSLPSLSARIESLVSEAEVAVRGYGENSSFNRETVAALREVREAAEALTKLARQIERNPNSLLFGR